MSQAANAASGVTPPMTLGLLRSSRTPVARNYALGTVSYEHIVLEPSRPQACDYGAFNGAWRNSRFKNDQISRLHES